MKFKKAERKESHLRIALSGPSGSGKTYSALLMAKGLGSKSIAVIDTERGSASLYSDLVDFDTLELTAPFTPQRYIDAIKLTVSGGYDTLIIDSITHEWNGSGGCLEMVDVASKTKFKGNSYMAWSSVTPKHNAFLEAILQSPLNVICTLRSKHEYVITENAKGKSAPQKVGMAPVQRDGIEYEFTAVLDLSVPDHYAMVSKNRTSVLSSQPFIIDESIGEGLKGWLSSAAPADDLLASALVDMELSGSLDQLRDKYTWYLRELGNRGSEADIVALTNLKDELKVKLDDTIKS